MSRLLFNAITNGDLKTVQNIIKTNENWNVRLAWDYPLHLCAMSNETEIAAFILNQENVDINSRGHSEHTPLHYAVYFQKKKMIKFLIDSGANLKLKNDKGQTAEQYAQNFSKEYKTAHIQFWYDWKTCDILLNQVWIMESQIYSNYFQWLPREIVEDVLNLFIDLKNVPNRSYYS